MTCRADVVAVVKSWEGAKQGSATQHKIIDIFNSKVGGMSYTAPWCAATASAGAIKAGAASYYPLSASCGAIITGAKKMGIWVESDSYVPTIGDWVIYDWADGSNYAKYDNKEGHDHIGTVVAVSNGTFSVTEGNMGRPPRVGRRPMEVNGRYIRGFVHPRLPLTDADNEPSKPLNDAGLWYRAHVQKLGWLPAVRDGQIAGTVGKSLRMEAVKFTPPEGVTLTVNAHLQGVGWKSYPNIRKGKSSGTGSSKNDPIIGTVGESRRLEAIQIHAEGLPKGKRIRYRAHVQGKGWLPWVEDGKVAGTTGQSRRLEALQVEIV